MKRIKISFFLKWLYVATLSLMIALPVAALPTQAETNRVIAYLPNWLPPPSIDDIKAAGYTHVLYAFAELKKAGDTSDGNDGKVGLYLQIPETASNQPSQQYIRDLQAKGIKVLLTIGGSGVSKSYTTQYFNQAVRSDASSTEPSEDAKALLQSIKTEVTKYGFDGIDIDIEFGIINQGTIDAPTGDIAQLAYILNTLHHDMPNLFITMAPQTMNIAAANNTPFPGRQESNYSSLVMQTYEALTWVGVQLYNTGGMWGIDCTATYPDNPNSPDLSVAMAVDLLESWPKNGESGRCLFLPYISHLRPDQIVLGYPVVDSHGNSDAGAVKPNAVIQRAVQCLKNAQKSNNGCDSYVPPKAYGDIGGVFAWNIDYDADNKFRFACVMSGSQSDLCKGK